MVKLVGKTLFISMVLLSGAFVSASFAAVSQELITQTDAVIDTLRKRDCNVIVKINGAPLAGKNIVIQQTRNDFGFGASITMEGFSKDSIGYGEAFKKYFDWATPENEMKWTTVDEMDDYTDYSKGDYIVDWCTKNGIKVRGHNLFWNEDIKWVPTWAQTLDPVQFRAAMTRRIDGAITHYKGRVAHWDIINELIHYPQATHGTPEVTLFDSATADPDIFRWILSRSRKIDSTAKFAVNEYAILEDLDAKPETMDIFKTKMNRLLTDSSSFDVVGLEGHFGTSVVRENYVQHLNTVSAAIPRKIWLTEVDFSVPVETRADITEELMRTCFAYPNVGGLVLWVWWNGKRWGEHLNSVLVDSNFVETDMGLRWRTLREGWKTNYAGLTDNSAAVSFRGFHGEYVAIYRDGDKTYGTTFYLEPGTGAKTVEVNLVDTVVGAQQNKRAAFGGRSFMVNGHTIHFTCNIPGNQQLYLFTYTISGKLQSKIPLSLENGRIECPVATSGCKVFRIGTADKTIYAGRLMQVR